MNAFLILVLLLTIAYIIYYGIVASQDIIAAKKSGESTVETIEVSTMSDDHVKTVEVHETAEGFSIGNEETRISSPAASASALPNIIPATTAATTDKSSADIEEVREKMSPPVQEFSIDQSMKDYSVMLEGLGADCIMGVYKPENGTPIIYSFITPEASNPAVSVDENENIIEDNSFQTAYDNI